MTIHAIYIHDYMAYRYHTITTSHHNLLGAGGQKCLLGLSTSLLQGHIILSSLLKHIFTQKPFPTYALLLQIDLT